MFGLLLLVSGSRAGVVCRSTFLFLQLTVDLEQRVFRYCALCNLHLRSKKKEKERIRCMHFKGIVTCIRYIGA